jgi:hypothetical protein
MVVVADACMAACNDTRRYSATILFMETSLQVPSG